MSLFWLKAIVKAVNLEERTVEGFASTMQPDMIRDVILARAWRKTLARWKKRGSIPKFLGYHMHRLLDGHSPVLGPMLKLNIVQDGLMLKAEFAETELGNEHLHLYSIGAMDYFSVGFNIMPDGSTMDPDQVRRLLRANKIVAEVPQQVDRVITEAELFEVSCVVLGANLGALVTASANSEEFFKSLTIDESERKQIVHFAKKFLERLELCSKMVPDGSGAAVYENPETYAVTMPSEERTILSAEALEEACSDVDVEDGIDELIHPKRIIGTDGKKSMVTKGAESDEEATIIDPLSEIKKAAKDDSPESETAKDAETSDAENADDAASETDGDETRALDSKELSAIFESVKSLEARMAKLETGVESVQKSLDLLRNAPAGSGESGGEEPQTEPAADEAKGAKDEVDGVPVLKELLDNLEKAAGK